MAAKGNQAAPAPVAAAAPVVAAKPPTAEETAAQETIWCDKFLKDSKIGVTFSKDDVEKILEGGEEAAAILSARINPILAKTVLETRKSIYNELNPYFERANSVMAPLLEQQVQFERVATEQVFATRHPDFSGQLDRARQVAEQLIAQYPKETAAMNREQFVDEVAAQTSRILQEEYKRFNPTVTDTWRESLARQKVVAAAPAAAAVVAAPVVAAARPAVAAPSSNSPAAGASAAAGGATSRDWHKQTAASLVD